RPGSGRTHIQKDVATDSRRSNRASCRGVVLAGAGRTPPQRFRRTAFLGHRHYGRQRRNAGNGRAGRRSVPHARATGLAELRGRIVGSDSQSTLFNRSGTVAGGPRPASPAADRKNAERLVQANRRPHEKMVRDGFLASEAHGVLSFLLDIPEAST